MLANLSKRAIYFKDIGELYTTRENKYDQFPGKPGVRSTGAVRIDFVFLLSPILSKSQFISFLF